MLRIGKIAVVLFLSVILMPYAVASAQEDERYTFR